MFLKEIRNIFVSRTQILCPQQMLRVRANGETFVSTTMCPQLCVFKAVANEDTLLRTQKHLLRTQNLCTRHKNVSDFFRPQQMFPGLRSIETIMRKNVSAILCPRLPPPLDSSSFRRTLTKNLSFSANSPISKKPYISTGKRITKEIIKAHLSYYYVARICLDITRAVID